jgi:hypothetical protein
MEHLGKKKCFYNSQLPQLPQLPRCLIVRSVDKVNNWAIIEVFHWVFLNLEHLVHLDFEIIY